MSTAPSIFRYSCLWDSICLWLLTIKWPCVIYWLGGKSVKSLRFLLLGGSLPLFTQMFILNSIHFFMILKTLYETRGFMALTTSQKLYPSPKQRKTYLVGTPVFARNYWSGQQYWIPGTIYKRKRNYINNIQVWNQLSAWHKNQIYPRYT